MVEVAAFGPVAVQVRHGSVVHAGVGRSRRRCGKGENVCRRALLPLYAHAVDQREQMRMACRIAARCELSIARSAAQLHGFRCTVCLRGVLLALSYAAPARTL